MAEIKVSAKKREAQTKGALNQLRKSGLIPGVYYAGGKDPISVLISEKELKPVIYTAETHIIDLQLEGSKDEEIRCILKDVQFDPLTDEVLHFDLMGLTKGQSLQLEIPISLVGKAKGIAEGGILQQSLFKADIECLPRHIPESVEIDVSNLGIGDSISIGDLNIENVRFLNPENVIVVSVIVPKEELPEDEVEGELVDEEPAEPEVISKGKDENEEEGKE